VYALVWKVGPLGERHVALSPGQPITIGRDEACDVTIEDDVASRRHARIQATGDTIEIEDLASSNGTWLGPKRITKATWQPGTPLKIGDTIFFLRPEGDMSNADTVVVGKGGAMPARTASEAGTPAGNFITRHWRGGYSLGRSIFINTLLVSLLLGVVTANLTVEIAADSSPRGRLVFITVMEIITIAILLWQIVGDWRSWRGAKARGAGRFARLSAFVLIALITLSPPLSLIEFVDTWKGIRDIETGRDSGGNAAYTLTKDDNVLVFDGVVSWPLVEDMRQAIENNPDIDVVLLNSPGGDTTASRRINDILRQRPLATAVLQGCASACTVIYAAGQRRAIGPNGQLGFHASAVILMDAMMTRIMNALTFRSDTLNAEYYRRAGFDEAFIERAVTTPSTDLYVPTTDVLLQANVVHDVLPDQ